jgi:tryptophan-rich sensory protein
MPDPITSLSDDPRSRRHERGVIPPRRARQIAFGIVVTALTACTLLSLLAIWDCMARDVLWRALATITVIVVATGLFTVVNEHFGSPADRSP